MCFETDRVQRNMILYMARTYLTEWYSCGNLLCVVFKALAHCYWTFEWETLVCTNGTPSQLPARAVILDRQQFDVSTYASK